MKQAPRTSATGLWIVVVGGLTLFLPVRESSAEDPSSDPSGESSNVVLELEEPLQESDRVENQFFSFFSRRVQEYQLRFAARPDDERFQIQRYPTACWTERKNFYLKLGDVSHDEQIQLKEFDSTNADSSGLTILHLPSGEEHLLRKGEKYLIPTYFAELASLGKKAKNFFVKEGAEFQSPDFPEFKFRLFSVSEDHAILLLAEKDGVVKWTRIEK